jgi:hypothetical protein
MALSRSAGKEKEIKNKHIKGIKRYSSSFYI